MPNPPTEVTVEKVLSQPGDPWGGNDGKSCKRTYDEVLFQGDGQTRKAYVDEDVTLEDGATVKGWFNGQKGTWSIVGDGPPQNSGGRGSAPSQQSFVGRDDATGQSIERQVAAKCAAEMVASMGEKDPVKVDAAFDGFFDTIIAKIQGGGNAS